MSFTGSTLALAAFGLNVIAKSLASFSVQVQTPKTKPCSPHFSAVVEVFDSAFHKSENATT